MEISTNKLFQMLSWDNDELTQLKGIEEGKKIKYLSVLFQPFEDKSVWNNCAKIIVQKSNEELEPYLYSMMEWLQDANWPGYDIIHDRINQMPAELIFNSYLHCVNKAIQTEDESWLTWLSSLLTNTELRELLSPEVVIVLRNQYVSNFGEITSF